MPLHICAHESAVSVVIFEEWDHSGGDRDDLLRRNVHVVDGIAVDFGSFLIDASSDALIEEPIVIVQRFVGLRDDQSFFLISSHVTDVFGYFVIKFVDAAIRSFDETILIDATVVRK